LETQRNHPPVHFSLLPYQKQDHDIITVGFAKVSGGLIYKTSYDNRKIVVKFSQLCHIFASDSATGWHCVL